MTAAERELVKADMRQVASERIMGALAQMSAQERLIFDTAILDDPRRWESHLMQRPRSTKNARKKGMRAAKAATTEPGQENQLGLVRHALADLGNHPDLADWLRRFVSRESLERFHVHQSTVPVAREKKEKTRKDQPRLAEARQAPGFYGKIGLKSTVKPKALEQALGLERDPDDGQPRNVYTYFLCALLAERLGNKTVAKHFARRCHDFGKPGKGYVQAYWDLFARHGVKTE